jgi:hypothetical protein
VDTENTQPDQNVEAPAVVEAPEVPAFLRDMDPAKREEVLAKLAAHKAAAAEAAAIEGTQPAEEAPAKPEAEVLSGETVEWSEYRLEYSVKHLYKGARYQNTPQGPKWVAMVDEFFSTERDFRSHGKKVKNLRGEEIDALNLGEFLNDMLNGPEGWKLISVLPSSSARAGILMQRAVPIILPDPVKIETETTVAAPKDEELAAVTSAADAFAAEVGGADTTAQTPEDVVSDLRATEEEAQQ